MSEWLWICIHYLKQPLSPYCVVLQYALNHCIIYIQVFSTSPKLVLGSTYKHLSKIKATPDGQVSNSTTYIADCERPSPSRKQQLQNLHVIVRCGSKDSSVPTLCNQQKKKKWIANVMLRRLCWHDKQGACHVIQLWCLRPLSGCNKVTKHPQRTQMWGVVVRSKMSTTWHQPTPGLVASNGFLDCNHNPCHLCSQERRIWVEPLRDFIPGDDHLIRQRKSLLIHPFVRGWVPLSPLNCSYSAMYAAQRSTASRTRIRACINFENQPSIGSCTNFNQIREGHHVGRRSSSTHLAIWVCAWGSWVVTNTLNTCRQSHVHVH